ncbi:MAG: NUDIX domain-containing protein [Candidatus Pacebacteria bacterium]|nr:NUDIX domain-containing protein [Candidatus Paceibacterota bacterium]
MKVPLVNEQDEIIGYKDRADRNETDILRVSALCLKHTDGRVLLAQRGLTLKNGPGKWGPAVAGTVEEDETYESNIVKESMEEIGYPLTVIKEFTKIRVQKRTNNYFAKVYIDTTDWPIEKFKIDPREVEQIKWFTKPELREFFKDKEKLTDGLSEHSELFLSI